MSFVDLCLWSLNIMLMLPISSNLNLSQQGGRSIVKEFFDYYIYRVSEPAKDQQEIVGIKYVDGINKNWTTVWAREARGRFYCNTPTGAVSLKDGLQRGVEVSDS